MSIHAHTQVYVLANRRGRFFDERVSKDATYPSTRASVGDSPEYEDQRADSPVEQDVDEEAIAFAPPGPCYEGLRNNVSTHEMEMQSHSWKPGTEEFVNQRQISEYLHDTAAKNDVLECVRLNTRVEELTKIDGKWRMRTTTLTKRTPHHYSHSTHHFDAVVVANGHYHAPNIPDIPGLSAWKAAFPDRVLHSKLYRRPDKFRDQNVLLVGAGVSSTDIARELGGVARATFQVSRGGMYDLPSHLLPDNAARVGAIASFGDLNRQTKEGGTIPGTVHLSDNTQLCDIHRVVLCTGYHVSFPFLRSYHSDNLISAQADQHVLVTDGQQTHNLHKDIFYIPDPTLAFVGVPYHTATFSFFEFQAVALAEVFGGRVPLPSMPVMREVYEERLRRKGAGRTFHSLKGVGEEIEYVDELVRWVNGALGEAGESRKMLGHSAKWLASYERRLKRAAALKNVKRERGVDEALLAGVVPCV